MKIPSSKIPRPPHLSPIPTRTPPKLPPPPETSPFSSLLTAPTLPTPSSSPHYCPPAPVHLQPSSHPLSCRRRRRSRTGSGAYLSLPGHATSREGTSCRRARPGARTCSGRRAGWSRGRRGRAGRSRTRLRALLGGRKRDRQPGIMLGAGEGKGKGERGSGRGERGGDGRKNGGLGFGGVLGREWDLRQVGQVILKHIVADE